MSHYESARGVDPARIDTIARARKQWRREGITDAARTAGDYFQDEAPEAVR